MNNMKERLAQAIEESNLSRSELCSATGISRSGISQYLSGINIPRHENLVKLAEVLGVNEAWLLGYNVPKDRMVVEGYTNLNEIGKQKVREYMEDMLKIYSNEES